MLVLGKWEKGRGGPLGRGGVLELWGYQGGVLDTLGGAEKNAIVWSPADHHFPKVGLSRFDGFPFVVSDRFFFWGG